jgi:hypothetical protein
MSPLNYRPISLLNSLGKLFEKIILKRLYFQLRELKAIRNDQYGFRRGHSTTYVLLRNVDTHGFNNSTVTLFLDIERAFDKVWTTGIIFKLIKAKTLPHLIHLIHNYLQNGAFFVKHINSYSSIRPIQAGVPQGSSLGPTLSIFILMTFHRLKMTLILPSRSILMTGILVSDQAV